MRKKITTERVISRIVSVKYYNWPGTTVTSCLVKLENGFSVRGDSACLSVELTDYDRGKALAYENAVRQVWQLEGYLLAEDTFRAKRRAELGAADISGALLGATPTDEPAGQQLLREYRRQRNELERLTFIEAVLNTGNKPHSTVESLKTERRWILGFAS